jgi:hypothetical protein
MRVKGWTAAGALAAFLLPAAGWAAGPDPATPAGVFERLKGLAGAWEGRSTKGWTDTAEIKVIAGGSVVEQRSFESHPGQEMRTLFSMDGERLVLTHYCVAKRHPRLLASAIEDGGNRVTFTFLDGLNLPSRELGHMDKLVLRFQDDDHYVAQWTWYQDGRESWMEEIHRTRVRGDGR